MRTTSRRVAAAVLSAAVLTFAGVSPALALSPSASAPAAAGLNEPSPALIDPSRTGTLHITKYAGAPIGGYDNGLPNSTISSNTTVAPLAGVVYEIYPVTGVDLLTNAGWTTAASYYANIALAEANLGTMAGTCTTTATGTCDLSGLPLGLYYVKEVSAPAGYTMAAPFLVTLPMTDPDGPDNDIATTGDNRTSWMYDVYVYPKNQQDTITKAVEDKGTVTTQGGVSYGQAGDHVIDYTITTSITDGTNPLGMYVIYDDLDPSLTFTGAEVKVGTTTLTAGTDYTVWTGATYAGPFTAYTSGTVAAGPVVIVVMTDAGLAKLEADRTASVVTTVHTTVGAEDADGVVPNTASFIPNENWWAQNMIPGVNPETPGTTPPGTEPGLPSNEVKSRYGDLQITKKDGGDPAKLLAGAEFTVFADGDNDEACTAADTLDAYKIGGVVTTDANGYAVFKGLQTSDWYNNAQQTDLLTYCLVETKAPAGYNLSAQPIAFTILWATGTETTAAAAGSPAFIAVTVMNELQNLGNNLPLTGGAGVAAVSGLGLVLVGGGLAYFVIGARRRREEQDA